MQRAFYSPKHFIVGFPFLVFASILHSLSLFLTHFSLLIRNSQRTYTPHTIYINLEWIDLYLCALCDGFMAKPSRTHLLTHMYVFAAFFVLLAWCVWRSYNRMLTTLHVYTLAFGNATGIRDSVAYVRNSLSLCGCVEKGYTLTLKPVKLNSVGVYIPFCPVYVMGIHLFSVFCAYVFLFVFPS